MTSPSAYNLSRPVAAVQAAVEAQEEVQLVVRVQAGDKLACDLLVRRFSQAMHRTARRILRSEADSADAVQDAFLSAFRGIGSFDGNARVSTWLHRIVVNACLMKLRGRVARGEVLRREPEATPDACRDLPCLLEEDAYSRLARAELRARVRRCIERLREPHRTILILRDIEELDTEEAATLLGISCGAVKVRLHRARQALRALLAPPSSIHQHRCRSAAKGRLLAA